MGFPEYKHYWLFGVGLADGWDDRGQIGRWNAKTQEWEDIEKHAYCFAFLRIGRENSDIFKFCPQCLVKIED